MLFIGFAIVIALGLALLFSSDLGALSGLSEDQLMRIVPLLIILIIVGGGLFSRRYRAKELFGNLFIWAGVLVMALVGYTYREDLGGVASRVFGELVPGTPTIDESKGTVTFRSGFDGHFKINAGVNGATVHTIFDTGASAVVLTQGDARRAGIDTDVLSYTVRVATANGTGKAASIILDRVEVGGIVRNNVRAFVAEKGALDTSLLGMTFLGTLSRYAVSGTVLELTD